MSKFDASKDMQPRDNFLRKMQKGRKPKSFMKRALPWIVTLGIPTIAISGAIFQKKYGFLDYATDLRRGEPLEDFCRSFENYSGDIRVIDVPCGAVRKILIDEKANELAALPKEAFDEFKKEYHDPEYWSCQLKRMNPPGPTETSEGDPLYKCPFAVPKAYLKVGDY